MIAPLLATLAAAILLAPLVLALLDCARALRQRRRHARAAEEWRRHFARGLTSKRLEEWIEARSPRSSMHRKGGG